MGRPSSATHPTVVIRHLDTGDTVAWCDGEFAGSQTLTDAARAVWAAGGQVSLGRDVYPITDGPHGAAAVMLAVCKGRGMIATGINGPLTNGLTAGEPLLPGVFDVPQQS